MTASTQIVPFVTQSAGAGGNRLSPAAYAALTTVLAQGFQSGIMQSAQLNTVLAQSSFMAAGLANWMVAQGVSVPDDGNISNLVSELNTALLNYISASSGAAAAGTLTGNTISSNVLYSSLLGFGTAAPAAHWEFFGVNAGGIIDSQVKNSSTGVNTQARYNLVTGTANSYSYLYLLDANQLGIITGSAVSNGIVIDSSNANTSSLTLKSGSGGINLNSNSGNVNLNTGIGNLEVNASSANINEIAIKNAAFGASVQARLFAGTGTNGSTVSLYVVDNGGTPYAGIAVGSAVTSLALPANTVGTTQATNDSSSKFATTQFANPGALLSGSGYVKFPSGVILQWMQITRAAGTTVTFPITFPTACRVVLGNDNGGASQAFGASSITASQFTVQCSGTISAGVIAIGY